MATVSLKRRLLGLVNFWPPFLGAGIRIKKIAPDMRQIEVEMPLRIWNRNYVGVHYGGSLYSLADPFYMLMLIENLGPEYVVWDKAAEIRFKKPGRGLMRASFELTQERIDTLRQELEQAPKIEPVFEVKIEDEAGDVVAIVKKTIHIKKASASR